MGIMVVAVNFTTDEAAYLASLLARLSEAAPANSAEKFWVERLYNRVNQEMVDVVAADSAARLAASSASPGFPFPPPPAPAPPPANAPSGQMNGVCACGHPVRSRACQARVTAGTHP